MKSGTEGMKPGRAGTRSALWEQRALPVCFLSYGVMLKMAIAEPAVQGWDQVSES